MSNTTVIVFIVVFALEAGVIIIGNMIIIFVFWTRRFRPKRTFSCYQPRCRRFGQVIHLGDLMEAEHELYARINMPKEAPTNYSSQGGQCTPVKGIYHIIITLFSDNFYSLTEFMFLEPKHYQNGRICVYH